MEPTNEQIQELKYLFFEKLNKEGAPCQDGFHPDDIERVKTADVWVRKFLEQHDLDMSLALDMLWKTCEWRKNYGTNELNEDKINMEYVNAGLAFYRNRDIDGKVLYILRTSLHVKGVRDNADLLKCFVYTLERLYREENYDKITLFFDLAGAGLSNLDIEYTKQLINVIRDYYPDSLNYIIIYELPWLLNAAFRIIKALLPPKAVAVMKFVNSKNLHEYVTEENQLTCWGGKDDYTFKFIPEKRVDCNGNDISSNVKKKVHFATNNSTDYFTMPDASEKNNAVDEGTMLRMNPSEAIVFQSSGSEMIGTVEISNADSNTVAYKIKTTSPEKYRVRPSTGILTPGASACINVVLQQGQDISTLNRDKFLVMCTEFDTSNKQDLSEFWKLLPNNSAAVEQHRLKCSLPLNAMNGNGAEMKNLSFNDSLNVDGDNRESVNLLKSMHQLHNSIHRLESQLKFNRTLQWITLVTFFLLTLAIIYLLKMEIQNNSVEYCSMKRE